MFKKVAPYMGEYKKYTAFAARMLSMISVALGEMLFGVLNDTFIVYVSIFIGAIGVGIGSIMYSIVDKYHIYAKREEN